MKESGGAVFEDTMSAFGWSNPFCSPLSSLNLFLKIPMLPLGSREIYPCALRALLPKQYSSLPLSSSSLSYHVPATSK
jgi:hypothetical protein